MIRVLVKHPEYSGTSVGQAVKSMKFEVLLPVFPVQLLGLVAVTPANEGWVSHSSLLFCLKGNLANRP